MVNSKHTPPAACSGQSTEWNSSYKNWPFWVGMFIWLSVAAVAVLSVQLVKWTTPQPAYILVLVLAFALAVVSACLIKKRWLSILIFISSGFFITIWQSVILFQAPPEYTLFQSVFYAFDEWSRALARGNPSENSVYFSVLLIILFWVWGYLGTFKLITRNRFWIALFFGLAIVLINLLFLNKAFYFYFYLYLLLSMVMVGFFHFVNLNYFNGVFMKPSPRVLAWICGVILGFTGILVFLTWLMPEVKTAQLRDYLELKIQNSNLIEKLDINIFNSVSSKDTVVRSTDQNDLRFANHPDMSESIRFRITSSSVPNYWRTRRYDVYNPWGWTSSPVIENPIEAGEFQPPDITPADHYTISYIVTNKVKTDIVISTGKHLSTDAPSIVNKYKTSNPEPALNPDDSVVSISTPHIYSVDDRYSVTADIIKPTVSQLQQSAGSYPSWIISQNLQLPPQFPFSIARLSQTIVRNQPSKYDQVVAVIDYLSRYKYIPEGTFPPENKDGVSDFIFVRGTGNCTNFASAAVVMLRSVGVPARLCTGYIPHYIDKDSNTFVVLSKDYHAWIEVYFNGFGWIEFEATPSSTVNILPQSDQGDSVRGLSNASFRDFPYFYYEMMAQQNQAPGRSLPVSTPAPSNWRPSVTLFILVILVLVLVALVLFWRSKMKRRDAISSVMARIQFLSPLIGVPHHPAMTAREYADSLATKMPVHREKIEKLTSIYLASRYSREKMAPADDSGLVYPYWRSLFWGLLKRTILRRN